MAHRVTILAVFVALITAASPAYAVPTKAVQEAVEYVSKKFAAEVGQESAETLAARLTKLAARHGDEALVAFRKVGPRAFRLAEEAGELEGRMNRLLADIGRLVIEGDGCSPGLRAQLVAFDRARSYVRRTALERLILGQDAPHAASQPHDQPGNSLQHFNTKGR